MGRWNFFWVRRENLGMRRCMLLVGWQQCGQKTMVCSSIWGRSQWPDLVGLNTGIGPCRRWTQESKQQKRVLCLPSLPLWCYSSRNLQCWTGRQHKNNKPKFAQSAVGLWMWRSVLGTSTKKYVCMTVMSNKLLGCAGCTWLAINGWGFSAWTNHVSFTKWGQRRITLCICWTTTKLQNFAWCFCLPLVTKIIWAKYVAFAGRAMVWLTWSRGREDIFWSERYSGGSWKKKRGRTNAILWVAVWKYNFSTQVKHRHACVYFRKNGAPAPFHVMIPPCPSSPPFFCSLLPFSPFFLCSSAFFSFFFFLLFCLCIFCSLWASAFRVDLVFFRFAFDFPFFFHLAQIFSTLRMFFFNHFAHMLHLCSFFFGCVKMIDFLFPPGNKMKKRPGVFLLSKKRPGILRNAPGCFSSPRNAPGCLFLLWV